MVNKIIRFSVYNRGLIFVLTLLLAFAGVYSFQHLPIDAVPDITNNQVQINTSVSGLIPEEIERTVTYPVESSMRGLAGVEEVRSITRYGLSQVTVIFKEGIDIYRARQVVSERLQGVVGSLPKGADAELGPISTGLGEIFQYTLDFKNIERDPKKRFEQLIEAKAVQDWFVKPATKSIDSTGQRHTPGTAPRLTILPGAAQP